MAGGAGHKVSTGLKKLVVGIEGVHESVRYFVLEVLVKA